METKQKKRGIGALNRIVENDFIHRVSADEYREKVKDVYGGPQGALLATASHLSMHVPFGPAAVSHAQVRPSRDEIDSGRGQRRGTNRRPPVGFLPIPKRGSRASIFRSRCCGGRGSG